MTVRVNREEFLRAIESIQPGLSPKDIIEQSSCVVFSKGYLKSFNDEISCQCPIEFGNGKSLVGKIPEGAVQAKSLMEILHKLPEEELEIETKENEIVLIGKGRKSGIRLEKEVTLPIDSVEKPKDWIKLDPHFGESIGIVQNCAGNDAGQFALTCVNISQKWVESCDNTQLCRWKITTGIKAPTLVRKESIKHIVSLGMTELSETESWLHFRNPHGLILSCRRYMEDFPDLSKVLEVEGEPIALPPGLAEAADKAAIFSSENVDNNQVLIDLKPGWLRIKGQGISGWYTETKKIKYSGKSMSFLVAPNILADLVKKTTDCFISEDRIKVDSGSYLWVSCLERPVEKKKKEEETNVEVEE